VLYKLEIIQLEISRSILFYLRDDDDDDDAVVGLNPLFVGLICCGK
jgi:hypothetical protein